MSKYDPLRRYLGTRIGDEAPLTFAEVEKVLGFRLPDSARQYPAWWSNNVGTHVGVRAWRDAGWKTARVDLGAERVTFVREPANAQGMQESAPSPWADAIPLPVASLSKAALRLIDDYAEEARCGRDEAVAAILDACALERRRQLLQSFATGRPPTGFDSTAAVREDRDGR